MEKKSIEHNFRLITKIALDASAFFVAICASFYLRFSLHEAQSYLTDAGLIIPGIVIMRLIIYAFFKLYTSIWRYSSIHTLASIVKATTLGSIAIITLNYILGHHVLPRSIVVMDWLLVVFLSGGIRLATRHIYNYNWTLFRLSKKSHKILIFGAGKTGESLLRNIESSANIDISVVGFIDDDPTKRSQYIHNKRILGDKNDIGEMVRKYGISSIYIAIPELSGEQARGILRSIQEQAGSEIQIMTIPGLGDMVKGRVTINQLRKFEIKDLLRRKPVSLEFGPVIDLIDGKTVLVVGGGGSIGSELCRQIAQFNPARLLIIDNCELNCYNTEDSIKKLHPNLVQYCFVADACNEEYMRRIFDFYRPNLVFHAAAYKHVPLMETNPWAAVQNNIQSTLTLTKVANEFGAERFILISTDKAVQPRSIMGATKRICELITLVYRNNNGTKYIAVRFGNVLGSSGSVIHRFKQQIEQGGPITVTHPDITRYFMLISEAVELVLQAGAIGENGNIFVLEMGEPIRITDLAKYMIELSGLKTGKDIDITITGLRPGEKLHESLLLEGEEDATEVPNLLVLRQNNNINSEFLDNAQQLLDNLFLQSPAEIRRALKKLVPEYSPEDSLDAIIPFAKQV